MITKNLLKSLFISLFFTLSISLNSYSKDLLWNKTVELSGKSSDYKAKEVVTSIHELDKSGNIKSTNQIYQKIRIGKEIKYDTYKALKDGKDITNEYKEKSKNRKNRNNFIEQYDIFHPDNQKNITSTKLNSENINGDKFSVYDYSYKKNEKEIFEGKAWINEKTGKPLKLVFSMNPLPIGVKKLDIVYFYNSNGDKIFLDKLQVSTQAGLLLFYKYYEMKVELKNYFKIS